MRRFIIDIGKLVALVFFMAIASDRILDQIFIEVSTRGNLYSAIKTLDQIKKPELLVIGNSRLSAYNIVPKILEEKLPFQCYNLGFSDANRSKRDELVLKLYSKDKKKQ